MLEELHRLQAMALFPGTSSGRAQQCTSIVTVRGDYQGGLLVVGVSRIYSQGNMIVPAWFMI